MYICKIFSHACEMTTLIKINTHIYFKFFSFQKSKNNVQMFFIWNTMFHFWNTMNFNYQFDVFREWTRSKNEQKLYEQLIKNFQNFQNVKQFVLIMIVLMNYRRFFFNVLNCIDQFINDNFLIDLNVHFRDCLFENNEKMTKQMIFALLRIFYFFANKYENLITFFEIIFDRKRFSLHFFDEFIDHYFRLKIFYRFHKTIKLKLSDVKMSKFEKNDDLNWINITQSKK